MFTSIDKALVAAIMAGIYLVNTLGGFNFGLPDGYAESIAAVLTPILVYFFPNKQK